MYTVGKYSGRDHRVTISPLPQGAEAIETAIYILSLQLVFATTLFMCCLLKSNFLVLCRFVSPASLQYNFVSFLLLCLAAASVVRH